MTTATKYPTIAQVGITDVGVIVFADADGNRYGLLAEQLYAPGMPEVFGRLRDAAFLQIGRIDRLGFGIKWDDEVDISSAWLLDNATRLAG